MLNCPIAPTTTDSEFVQLARDYFGTDLSKREIAKVKIINMSTENEDRYADFTDYKNLYLQYIENLRAYEAQEKSALAELRQKQERDRKELAALKASRAQQQKELESAQSNVKTLTNQYKDLSDREKKLKAERVILERERDEQRQKFAGDQPKKKGGFFKKIFG